VTRSLNYPANLCISSILAVALSCNIHRLEIWGARLHPETTMKLLSILRSWTFDHQRIPQLLLTARLGLGIQHCALGASTQRVMVNRADVSGQYMCPFFNGQESKKVRKALVSSHIYSLFQQDSTVLREYFCFVN